MAVDPENIPTIRVALAALFVVLLILYLLVGFVEVQIFFQEGEDRLWMGQMTWQWIPFVTLCVIFVNNLISATPVFIAFVKRRFRTQAERYQRAAEIVPKVEIAAVVPCYMPNEQTIIEETLDHIIAHLDSPSELTVWCVYNSPTDLPEIEAKLKHKSELSMHGQMPRGRKLNVMRVHGSKSKAENLNAVLKVIPQKYVAIYDADHHPDSDSLMLLYEQLDREGLDCVQGSTYIRKPFEWFSFMPRLVDAEFFVQHFMFFAAMKLMLRNAVFCGSNALWEREKLLATEFDHKMQTEDIDISVRSLLAGLKIGYLAEARSGELACSSMEALHKQRLRWALGWEQVSMKYFSLIGESDSVSTGRAIALRYLLYIRYFTLVLAIVAGILTPFLFILFGTFKQRPVLQQSYINWGVWTVFFADMNFTIYLMIITLSVVEGLLQVAHRGLSSLMQAFFCFLYLAPPISQCYLFFSIYLIVKSQWQIRTGRVGAWVVTTRATVGNEKPASLSLAAVSALNPSFCAEDDKLAHLVKDTNSAQNSAQNTGGVELIAVNG